MLTDEMTAPLSQEKLRWLLSQRLINSLGFTACVAMMGFGYFLQYIMNLEPCPMCILQRIAIVTVGFVFLLAALHNPRRWGARIYAALLALTTGIGAALSLRHVWLQNFLPADRELACGGGLDYMLEVFSPGETLAMVLAGTGDCTEVAWSFLGLSIPAWTLVCFILLGSIGVTRNWIRV